MNLLQIPEIFIVFLAVTGGACSHVSPQLPAAKETTQTQPISSRKAELSDNRAQNLRQGAYDAYLRGEFPRAISQLETSFTLEGQNQEIWPRYILFYCYLATGDYERSLSIAESIVKKNAFQSLPYQQVGLAQLWLGQASQAISNFQRALDFEAHAPRIHFYLGLAYARLGQDTAGEKAFQEAEAEYAQILKANPKDFNANYELASLYLYWNRHLEKVPHLLTATRESFSPAPEEDVPQEKKIYLKFYIPLLEGILLYQKGDASTAQRVLLDLVPDVPSGIKADLAEVYFYLGKTYQSTGEVDLARNFLEKSASLDPKGAYSAQIEKLLRAIASRESIVP